MPSDQVCFHLLGLHGKLRRATDPTTREALQTDIDRLVTKLGTADRASVAWLLDHVPMESAERGKNR
jgi:hypothetical protein